MKTTSAIVEWIQKKKEIGNSIHRVNKSWGIKLSDYETGKLNGKIEMLEELIIVIDEIVQESNDQPKSNVSSLILYPTGFYGALNRRG